MMTESEIDDRIEEWHASDSDVPLHVFLGMTWEEYSLFVSSPSQFFAQRSS